MAKTPSGEVIQNLHESSSEQNMDDLLMVPIHQELNERIKWLIRLRWFGILCALAMIVAADILLPGVLPMASLFATVAVIALYNLGLHLYVRKMDADDLPHRYRHSAVIAHLQIALDMASLTVLLHFSGGLENPFLFYYVLLVIMATILLARKASFWFAGLAIVLSCGLLILEAQGIVPHYNLRGYRLSTRYAEPIHVASVSVALSFIILLTTYFASSVVADLRARTRELVGSNLACELRTKDLMEANLTCELRTQELMEANLTCELRTQELAELNEKLKELDDARMQFTLLVTHELRAPVAAIHSYLKLILEGYVPAEKQREILERSASRAREQLDLIADLLELGKIQQRGLSEQVEPVQVDQVLGTVIETVRTWAGEKGVALNTEISPDLPPVMAAPNHIRQLWMNLVSNAIKYTRPGGSVVASIRREGGRIVGTVKDTGIGISPEDQKRIFQDFFRTNEAKAMERQGTGLGLSIVQRIVKIYGGEIGFESEAGKGSTFTFTLPNPDMPE